MTCKEILSGKFKESKNSVIDKMINTYNLPLNRDEISRAFTTVEIGIISNDMYETPFRYKCEFLFDALLNNNKNMFVAMIKAQNAYRNMFPHLYVSGTDQFNIGYYSVQSDHFVINAYKLLLNHYDFDIDNLVLPENCKLKIREYRDKKYSGAFSKPVN